MALFPTPESPTTTHFARSRRGMALGTVVLCVVGAGICIHYNTYLSV